MAVPALGSVLELLPRERPLLVARQKLLHALLGEGGWLAHVEPAAIGDVHEHQLRLLARRLQSGERTDLRDGSLGRLGGEEDEALVGSLGGLGEGREHRERRGAHLLRAAVEHHAQARLLVDAVGTRQVGDGRGPPREGLALLHGAACVGVDDGAGLGVDDGERRDPLHLEQRAQLLPPLVPRRDGVEASHRLEVLCELGGVLVARDEDELERRARGPQRLGRLHELRRERVAWGAPARREVEREHLAWAA
mmetsp:Transcript_32136/g.67386  ORF Transcript_32136/g.67386 Transcript_32136/m.67386 type:complete len:251 (-) Transcript_32136:558-1310(-)